jgi:hypothetical protein
MIIQSDGYGSLRARSIYRSVKLLLVLARTVKMLMRVGLSSLIGEFEWMCKRVSKPVKSFPSREGVTSSIQTSVHDGVGRKKYDHWFWRGLKTRTMCWRGPGAINPIRSVSKAQIKHNEIKTYGRILGTIQEEFHLTYPVATWGHEPISYREALLSTLLHATVYVFTQFAECTSTDCK